MTVILIIATTDPSPAIDTAKAVRADRARAAKLGRDRHERTFAARRDAMTARLRAEIATRPA